MAKAIVLGLLPKDHLVSCLWALSIHSDGSKSRIRHLLKVDNFVSKLVDLCYSAEADIVKPALRIIGNISTGSESQTN